MLMFLPHEEKKNPLKNICGWQCVCAVLLCILLVLKCHLYFTGKMSQDTFAKPTFKLTIFIPRNPHFKPPYINSEKI